jgi:hypothetical protein
MRARDQLEDMISKHAKKDLTKSDESRLQLGLEQNPILADLHAQVTGYLNSDPDIAEAYQIMQAAKARRSAFDLGHKNIISDSTLNDLDPERFAERVPRMTEEEKGDMARGYLRRLRGVAGIIDTDKAVSKEALDKITRQGNVDRMREAFGDEKTDATLRLAENETKKVTEARELLTKEKHSNTTSKNPIFKEPKTGLVRKSDIGMLGSAGLGLLGAYNGHVLPLAAAAGLAGAITGHRAIKKGRYENVMSDLAKASAYQGPKLSNLLDAVQKYQTKIPKKKTKAIENALLAIIQSGRLGGM